ncbi:RTA1 like protein-domain-containing protein [Thelonectria olida]|uniref:RTA1 like protein-domain-containing protein n=1 Tax=Thelonectria olida TaxID=1576542 RepID=A0A9P8VNU6_9HYPO|nr:RTA1 like protein-domain-containing protein [Thelonectria olida]
MEHYNLGANLFFLISFALLVPFQTYYGIRYKTWGFMFSMLCSLILEILGYTGRIGLHYGKDMFLMYIITLTIGPAFLSAAVYLCLARIIVIYGEYLARFKPVVYTATFMLFDLFALLLQSAGGALVGGDDPTFWDTGLRILQAGLSVHLVGITIYVILCADFAFSAYRERDEWRTDFKSFRSSKQFKAFCIALGLATLAILIRTAFRVAELSQGFDSEISENEPVFLVLDGTMILCASLLLTLLHPGHVFLEYWAKAEFDVRTGKRKGSRERGVELGSIASQVS